MNEQLSKQVLSEARRSMEPSKADRDEVLRRVLLTAAAATAAGTAAAGAKAAGAGTLLSAWLKGATIIKLGAALLLLSGAAAIWTTTRVDDAPPPKPIAVQAAASTPSATSSAPRSNASALLSTSEPTVSETPAPDKADETKTTVGIAPRAEVDTDMLSSSRAKHHRAASHAAIADEGINLKKADETDDSLYLEISAMKHASSALKDGNPEKANRILDDFEKTSKGGVMQQEREGLRVLALCAMGPSQAARQAENRFLERSSGSPMAARIRRACDGPE